MIPKNIQQVIIEEFVTICDEPANRGKFIAVATIIRRIENKYGHGTCKGINDNELREFIREVSGL